jgi:O-antigen/teichoic acid export membrane protein
VVRWSAVGLILQIASAAALIPTLGSTGAAVSVLISEAAIWFPLRRAAPQAHLVSGFSRTAITVPLKSV